LIKTSSNKIIINLNIIFFKKTSLMEEYLLSFANPCSSAELQYLTSATLYLAGENGSARPMIVKLLSDGTV
jgi:hypothetical protein